MIQRVDLEDLLASGSDSSVQQQQFGLVLLSDGNEPDLRALNRSADSEGVASRLAFIYSLVANQFVFSEQSDDDEFDQFLRQFLAGAAMKTCAESQGLFEVRSIGIEYCRLLEESVVNGEPVEEQHGVLRHSEFLFVEDDIRRKDARRESGAENHTQSLVQAFVEHRIGIQQL